MYQQAELERGKQHFEKLKQWVAEFEAKFQEAQSKAKEKNDEILQLEMQGADLQGILNQQRKQVKQLEAF